MKTKATKDQATTGLVPELRFPEFRTAEGWKGVPLSDLVSALDAGVSVNSGDRPATKNEVGILKTSAVTNGDFDPQENKVVIDDVERERVKEPVKEGTIIISRMNTPALVGANAYVESSLENIFLPDRLWAAKARPGTSMRFLAYVLGSNKGRAALSKMAKGSSGSMKNITKPDVLAFVVDAPAHAEQQKIANCLGSLDELIAAQGRKVEALKTHKKGLMQQLFPREGQTQPRLRFPEFENAGDWEVKAISEIFRVTRGEVLSMTSVQDEASEEAAFPVYSSQTKNKGLAGYYSEYLYEDAITWTTDGANAGDVNLRPGKFYCTNVCGVLINKEGYANACVAALLNGVTRSHVSYVGNPKLMNGVMAKIEIPLPSVVEQQRIAESLASLDALISSATLELDTLKTHKQGLMQQLFPSPEAVAA
jgi:restriction endonuclease S subunit